VTDEVTHIGDVVHELKNNTTESIIA